MKSRRRAAIHPAQPPHARTMIRIHGRKAAFMAVLTFIFFTCQHPAGDIHKALITLDIRQAIKTVKDLYLSDIAKSIEYIKLETTPASLISSGSLVVGKKYILFLNRQPVKLMLFDRSGRYLREIGKHGKGPGEFDRPAEIDLNLAEDKILVSSSGIPSKVYEYKTEGSFIRTAELSYFTEELYYMDQGYIYVQGRPFQDSSQYPRIIAVDQNFNNPRVLYRTDERRNPDQMAGYHSRTLFARHQDGFAYKEAIQDTVFHFDQRGINREISYILQMGEGRPQYHALTLEQSEAYRNNIDMVNEFSEYVLLLGKVGGNRTHLAYNKKTSEFFKLKKQSKCLSEYNYQYGLVDDFTGSAPYWYWEGADLRNNELCSVLPVVDLKELIESECFNDDNRLSTIKYRDELKSLVQNSKIDDNPIIRVIHLK